MCWAGLSLGDVPSRQPIGIVLTVLGVVVLDFSADATEGPIRAYLLDVVDSEEQDMALNIHAFSAGESAALPPPHPARGRTGSMGEAVPMAGGQGAGCCWSARQGAAPADRSLRSGPVLIRWERQLPELEG